MTNQQRVTITVVDGTFFVDSLPAGVTVDIVDYDWPHHSAIRQYAKQHTKRKPTPPTARERRVWRSRKHRFVGSK